MTTKFDFILKIHVLFQITYEKLYFIKHIYIFLVKDIVGEHFLSASLARARASTEASLLHFLFLSLDFDEIYLCILSFPLLLSNS